MFVVLFTFPTVSLVGRGTEFRHSKMGEACIPKKAEQPFIQTAKKACHDGCWYERLPVAADKENAMTDDAGRMRAVG